MTKRAKFLNSVKKNTQPTETKGNKKESSRSESSALVEQYQVIREDLMKLKDDLSRGYNMAREMYDKKTLMKDLMKIK